MTEILGLERLEEFLFRGRGTPTESAWMFGGEVVAQALMAAGRTVPPDRPVHSVHANFLRPGDPSEPVLYRVEATRDGAGFSTRRSIGLQHGKQIFQLTASFHVPEPGYRHEPAVAPRPGPETLVSSEETLALADAETRKWFDRMHREMPLEVRFATGPGRTATEGGHPPVHRFWFRSAHPLPDDPLLHTCVLAYASDLLLLASALPPHRPTIDDRIMFASLDHTLWLHGPVRADDWLFYDQEGLWAGGGRALCRGAMSDGSGRLVANVAQEGLIRVPEHTPGTSESRRG
ncbi:acyl-CoA thioesterase-2 [Actinocorallia herbida]|uniref:Acyl-CoA thioesterase-2 n=1 Tax=Actinocorallia herbida TaxID=58109 RepID=A0A3N1D2W9_9ACTN|nr:acyl-CoA thioesterase II [Actinocorallia herbida]ROO87885.1 acyl-CoA thioesterase-2 [Actinocorallia herbida]